MNEDEYQERMTRARRDGDRVLALLAVVKGWDPVEALSALQQATEQARIVCEHAGVIDDGFIAALRDAAEEAYALLAAKYQPRRH